LCGGIVLTAARVPAMEYRLFEGGRPCEGTMIKNERFYFGNAKVDEVRGSGWFVGHFVPPELGLRHQTDVELKWGIHRDGDKRSHSWASSGTTISVLIKGRFLVTFDIDGIQQEVLLQAQGDYVAFGPEVVHSWEAFGDTIVLSARFPSVEVGSQATSN
jgi:hypothetical protein